MQDDLRRELDAHFLSTQVLTHKAYQLSKPRLHRIHSGGDEPIFLSTEATVLPPAIGHSVDYITTDSNGSIVHDTRKERIEYHKRIAELVAKHRHDQTLQLILLSYDRAVNYPNTELVHLYEIRDTLAKKFQRKDKATAALSVSKEDWDSLGKLANFEPLHQGRHVGGKDVEELRSATGQELEEARKIARRMFESYLNYLEN